MAVHSPQVQLSLTLRRPGFWTRGGIPSGAVVIAFPLSDHQLLYYRGQAMAQSQVIALRHGEELEVQTSAVSLFLTVVIFTAFFDRQCLGITGKSFSKLTMIDVDGYRPRRIPPPLWREYFKVSSMVLAGSVRGVLYLLLLSVMKVVVTEGRKELPTSSVFSLF